MTPRGRASEKLSALAEKPVLNMFKLGDALPQIIAVVKASENECSRKERSDGTSTPGTKTIEEWASCADHPIPGVQRRIEMARALAALDEALS